jgi:hypothetical protein
VEEGTASELFFQYVKVMYRMPEIQEEIAEYEESVRDAAGAEMDFVL